MQRDSGNFDWGFGQAPDPADGPNGQPSLAQRLQQPQSQAEQAWNEVSYNPEDLGFAAEEVPRKSLARRIIPPILALAVIGGLLGAAAVGADGFARGAVLGVIQDKIAETLKIADEESVAVDLGGGLFIAQAAAGSIDDVSITAPQASVAGIVGDVSIAAKGVPTNQSATTDSLTVTLALDAKTAKAFAQSFRTNSKSRVSLGDRFITVVNKVADKKIVVAFIPTVDKGQIVLTPDVIEIAGKPMTIEEFASSKYAAAGAALIEPRNVCVADRLPAALALTSFEVSAEGASISATGSDVSLSSGAFSTLGTCDAE